MAGLANQVYSFSEDGIIRLQKDLDYMLSHLDDNNVRRLYTEYCEIKSEEGETSIVGPLLIMRSNGSTTVRLKAGWDSATSEFVFNLYGVDGSPTIELDSTGDAVMRGSINTGENVYIGNTLIVGWGGSTVLPTAVLSTAGIYIMRPGTTNYIAGMYTTFYAYWGQYAFEIESSANFNITGKNTMRIYMYADDDGTTSAIINSTDYMSMTAFNNRFWLGTYPADDYTYSSVQGLFIGDGYSRVFLDRFDDPYWQVTNVWDLDYNLNERLPYYYVHNQKYIAKPSTTWTVGTTVNTRLTATSNVMASTLGCRIVNLTTSAVTHEVQDTITSIDLTQFPDGTAMTSDDFLVIAAYVSSTAAISATGQKVYVALGQSSDANYVYRTTAHNYTTGWNLVYRKFTPDATDGAPALNNITWVRCGWQGVINTTSAYVAVDYIGVVRQDPVDNSIPNSFIRRYNSTETNEMDDPEFSLLINDLGTPKLLMTPTLRGTYDYRLLLKTLTQYTRTKVSFQSANASAAPSINMYFNSSAWMDVKLTSGVLRLNGSFYGTTYGDYVNVPAFNPFINAEITMSRYYDVWNASFRLTTDPESYREVSLYVKPLASTVSGQWGWGSIYLGGHDNYSFRISNASITKFNYRGITN